MRLNSRLLAALVLLLILLQLFLPYRGWVALLAAFGGALLIACGWAWSLRRGLHFQRERRFGLAQVGDQLEERFTLINESWLPTLWFEVIDGSTLPGYQISRASGVSGKASRQWTTQGICERRGLFTLGPTTLRTGDPFGIFTVEIQHPATTSVFVMPPIVPLPLIDIAPGGRAGEGRPRRRALERTVNAATVRSYVPGEDLRWIHWPTSARHDSLYVRLFENTPAGDWWIFLDLDQAAQLGTGRNATEEHAIILAASLADRGLRNGHAVGLVTHSETLTRLPPRVGSGQRTDILRALALAAPGPVPLANLLTHARPPLRELASLIIITPNVTGDWIEALLPLMRRGAVPVALLLDPVSYGGAASAAGLAVTLTNLKIAHYLVTRDLLDRPESLPGRQGRWQWRVSPTGRALSTVQPGETEWKPLN